MPARQLSAKKPKDLGKTLKTLLFYMGRHRFLLLAVAVLVTVSALANLLGNYMIRPIVNDLTAGRVEKLIAGVALTGVIYLLGVAASYGYTQIMVKAAQKVLFDIRYVYLYVYLLLSAAICFPTCKPCPSDFLTASATATL